MSKYGSWAHVFFAGVLFVASVVLVSISHGDKLERGLDFVTLYRYTKAVADKGKALDAIAASVSRSSWATDLEDRAHCLDMSFYHFPSVSFFPESDPTSPTCQITLNLASGDGIGQVKIAGIFADPKAIVNCQPGTYPLRITGGAGTVGLQPYLTIQAHSLTFNASDPVLTIGNSGAVSLGNSTLLLSTTGSVAFNYNLFTGDFATCKKSRQDLADVIQTSSSCEHGSSSPLCQCVHVFTSKLTNWNSKLKASYGPDLMLKDVLVNGIGRCIDLKRPHDVRKAVANTYARSSALLIFALALFFNSFLGVIRPLVSGSSMPTVWQALGLVVYGVSIFVAAMFDAENSVGEFGIALAVTLPVFFVHGGYCLLLKYYEGYNTDRQPTPEPFLHPVTFDLCLCALTLFTLVERGVVQYEYLIVEIFKCHAVAAIYIAVTWFHRYGNQSRSPPSTSDGDAGGIFAAASVQQAYLTLVMVGLGAACAPMVVPYPAKRCFELHWLLPGAFTYLALGNPAWAHSLKVSAKLNSGAVVEGFNEVAGILALLFGGTLWGYFLQDHIQIYGSAHFPYPAVRDPLSPFTMRML